MVAHGVPSTPPVECSFSALVSAHNALKKVIGDRIPAPMEKQIAKQADFALDAVYTGIFHWTYGISKISNDVAPGVAAKANAIAAAFFPDGLRFTKQAYQLQWADSQTRVDFLEERKLESLFNDLGGSFFVKALRLAHENYGKALGITEDAPHEEYAEIRAAVAVFTNALSRYVAELTEYANAGGENEAEVFDRLLRPLRDRPRSRFLANGPASLPHETETPHPFTEPDCG